jgi:crotonobetainyl-CoA:carnitine CoA-transferase CaiB-like acyl-CoA transferase
MVVEIEGPGTEKIRTLGNPLKMSETPMKTFSRPPRLGEHSRDILKNLLGYPEEKIDSLKERGILKTT